MTKTQLNLMSSQFCLRMLIRTRIYQWVTIWTICSIGLAVFWWKAREQLTVDKQVVAELEEKSSPFRSIELENIKIRRQMSSIRKNESLLGYLDKVQNPLRLIGLISKSARITDGQIKVEEFSLASVEQAENTPKTQTKSNKQSADNNKITRLTLEGRARDNLAIATFVASLRDSGIFHNVELKSSTGSEDSDKRDREYLIECTL